MRFPFLPRAAIPFPALNSWGAGSPVAVVEGENYFIVYQAVPDSYGSLSGPDDVPPGLTPEIIPFY
jgi:hypothetical protein